MANVTPFRAIRYNLDQINGSMEAVVAPPYDVIDYEEQEALQKKSPHNIVRLILGRQYDGDSPTDNRYTRAAARLDQWLDENVLAEDLEPAFYLYEQTCQIASGRPPRQKKLVRRGVLAALKLEPFGEGCVYPHEETFPSHKVDRRNLMDACRANLSPVFGLLPDAKGGVRALLEKAVRGRVPDVEIKQESGLEDRLWVISENAFCEQLSALFEPRKIFIADGHHRYETACTYRNERRLNDSRPHVKTPRAYDYVLMMCVPMSDPGLFILPTHRLVNAGGDFDAQNFWNKSAELFERAAATEAELAALAEENTGPVKFGVVLKSGERAILTAKPGVAKTMQRVCPEKSAAWRELDVAILHELLLKGILGIGQSNGTSSGGVAYTKSVDDVLARIQGPEGANGFNLGVIMRPTRIEQVCAISEGGERMPQKSTYFYPKLLSGLVMRRL